MHKKFNHEGIEKKWQDEWQKSGIYNLGARDESKEKEYVLVEWPYPSGNLHVGHWFAFAIVDIYVRARRMQGKQVLFPIGFDAFGLPAENAAMKRGLNPKEWTESNIAHMREQLRSMGNAFSWDSTTSSTDPEYYRWTQWMFTQFFEKGIAYRGTGVVNWCPGCHTVIANEQVTSDNTCERSGDVIEKRDMTQWMLRITDYADRLIDDLDTLDWPEHIKEAQRQWIGRSKGAQLTFTLSTGDSVDVFTTRPDTLFGATYLVLAPEHELVTQNKSSIQNWAEVETYMREAFQKDDMARTKTEKEKTGVRLEGITATNPATGKEIPVYIADYVLKGYGTGAIMAVPAHDERDFAFAKKYGIPVTHVIAKHLVYTGENAMRDGVETLVRDVVDVIIEHPTDGTFLLIKEKTEGGNVDVHFVGGGIDGESEEKAIARETTEESGFVNFDIVSGPFGYGSTEGYRHSKKKNQISKGGFYHVKLRDLERVHSEVEDGKHEMEWVERDDVAQRITWATHVHGWECFFSQKIFTDHGILVNSGEFDGMNSEEAKIAITEKVGGKMTSTYRLRDWSIGRQRYWGVPIPIVYDMNGTPHSIPHEHLPWHLPTDVDFTPTGEPPLAKSVELRERVTRIFGEGWIPEVETMDTFVDSSWYFLRYIDPHNDTAFSSIDAQKTWMPIDTYFGGAEHTTMHLLYSRFWHKALYDLGLVTTSEPYTKRINRGLVLGTDGNKMSKSKGNVIDPDEQVKTLGADTVKMYLAFLGPYGELANYPWDMGGIVGIRRFLERVYGLGEHIGDGESPETTKLLHKTVEKVTGDIALYKFNTAISALMIFINHTEKSTLTKESYATFLTILAPFAPHLAEELWHEAGNTDSVHSRVWPTADPDFLVDDTVTMSVQVNGKMKGTISVPQNADENTVRTLLLADPSFAQKLPENVVRVIFVPNKIINIIG